MTVFALRPEPGLGETLAALRALGLEAHGAPLSAIEPVAWEPVDPDTVDGLLLGSGNAVRHGGAHLRALAGKPVYAVGAKTADIAREAGFTIAAVGEGRLQGLLGRLPPPLRLLRLAGEAHVEVTPPHGIELTIRVVYRAVPLPLPGAFVQGLRTGGVALLHSAEAARRFAAESDRLGLDRGVIALAAIAPRVLVAAGEGWADGRAAATPDEAALLVLAGEMCQTSAE
jgi:uroporphyrinogen-III synthase